MLLNAEEIRARLLIFNSLEENFRCTSYDLRVGTIIDTNGNEHSQFHVKSSGVVEIISEEILRLENNVTGFAHVKTGLSCQGLLALNIGIIDPGWEGPISTTLVNFGGNKNHFIQKGDPFLRVTFIETISTGKPIENQRTPKEQYTRSIKRSFSQNFDEDFLSLETHIARKIKDNQKKTLESKIATYGIIFIIIQIALGYFFYMDPLNLNKSYKISSDISELRLKQDAILEQINSHLEKKKPNNE